jgi:hypothetical protein
MITSHALLRQRRSLGSIVERQIGLRARAVEIARLQQRLPHSPAPTGSCGAISTRRL